ncbi:hypothetical protein LINPERPRIM_LOCUS30939 [Linum perenne]
MVTLLILAILLSLVIEIVVVFCLLSCLKLVQPELANVLTGMSTGIVGIMVGNINSSRNDDGGDSGGNSDSSEGNLGPVEVVVHHGESMKLGDRGGDYQGGSVVEYNFDGDYLCYFQLVKIATKDLKYHVVEGMWFVKLGESIADGVHALRNDQEGFWWCTWSQPSQTVGVETMKMKPLNGTLVPIQKQMCQQ